MKRKLAILGAILLAAFIFTYEGNAYQAHALDEEDLAWIAEAGQVFYNIVYWHDNTYCCCFHISSFMLCIRSDVITFDMIYTSK